MTTKSSKLLHLDPMSIALEKRRRQEAAADSGTASADESSQPILSSQPDLSSQPSLSSQPIEPPSGGPVSKQPVLSSLPTVSSQLNTGNQILAKPLNLLASIPDIKGDARIPHRYSDYLCRLLKADEQAVYWQLYRLSWGWGQDTCFISNPKLSERSNVPLSSMKRAVAGLVSKGLIEKTGQANGYGKDQGVEYRVFTLGWQPSVSSQPNMSSQPNVASIKKEVLKENTKKGVTRLTPEEIQSFTAAVADLLRQGSTIEEVEPRFAPGMHPVDWAAVRSTAVAEAKASVKV